MSKDKFLKGAAILTIAGLIVKVMGAFGKIILARLLGAEALGLYNFAYPFYTAAISLAGAGVPAAIAIMIAEKTAMNDHYGAKRIFNISLRVLFVFGILLSVLMYLFAHWAIEYDILRDDRAYWALVALAPAILFVVMEAVFRGYFQGLQNMKPTGMSQMFEQLFRVVFMIGMAAILLKYGLEYGAMGASLGAAPGAVAGFVVLLVYYFNKRRNDGTLVQTHARESAFAVIKRIVILALPVCLTSLMLPFASGVDAVLVPYRLGVAGVDVAQSTTMFGYLVGMAVPLIAGVTVLTLSLSNSLVPAVSEARALGRIADIRKKTSTAYHIANLITIPAFFGLWLLATPIAVTLYKEPNAGLSIAITSIGIVMLGLQNVSTGTLQGLGKTAIPFIAMLVSVIVKIVVTWIFVAIPSINIAGAAWATNCDFGVAAIINMLFIYKYTGFGIEVIKTLRIVVASAIMGACSLGAYNLLMQLFHGRVVHSCILAMLVGGLVYIVAIFMVGGIRGEDLEALPKFGKPLAEKLRQYKIIRN
ncbi:MAG: polysaccharide biosynthesis protein [Negativicutes bacterium]|jgi:stage V sporulation protein B